MQPFHFPIPILRCILPALCAALLVFCPFKASAGSRGISVRLKASDSADAPLAEEVQLYEKSHALVIGIDDYDNGWPRLSNAVADAEKIAAGLKEKGFLVTFKKNLTSSELKNSLESFFIFQGNDSNARLFVWFAGHGHTIDGNGFLVPKDAPSPHDDVPKFKYTALSMQRFGEFVRMAKSKHTLAVFDSCFAGTIFDTRRNIPPAAITRMTTFPVRQFLTSGDSDQTVSDDGRFAKLFLRALHGEEKADFNEDGYLTGTELGLFITNRITNLTNAKQTPRTGKFLDEDFDRGDFVFVLPRQEVKTIVSIQSNISGAKVLVDDKYIGLTDLKEAEVPPGRHHLKIVKPGYRAHTQPAFFKEGKEIFLYINLTPIPPPEPAQPKEAPKALLFVDSSPQDATIKVDGISETFHQGMPLPAGDYLVVIEAEGHQPQSQWVTLESGKEKHISVELEWIEKEAVSRKPSKKKRHTMPPISF